MAGTIGSSRWPRHCGWPSSSRRRSCTCSAVAATGPRSSGAPPSTDCSRTSSPTEQRRVPAGGTLSDSAPPRRHRRPRSRSLRRRGRWPMTPFMFRIAELVGGPAESPEPSTRPSLSRPVGEGADRYVAVRSLAEQLVCEANAVLPHEAGLTLSDDVADGKLDFTIACGTHRARVSTTFGGGAAVGQLLRGQDAQGTPVELADADALPDLIVSLLVEAGVGRLRQKA